MSETVERVAKALEISGVDWQELFGLGGDPFPNIARIAIAAMREPTPGMIEAGRSILVGFLPGDTPERIWRAMIDAALAEKGE